MSKLYIRLLFIAAFVIAITGASFSIAGLAKLFAGASAAVAFMAAALEFAKLVVTGFLYRYWGHIHPLLRVYLSAAVVTLVGITSVGIFGFLSAAYQVSSLEYKRQDLKIQALNEEKGRLDKRMSDLNKFIAEIPASRVSRKFEFQRKYDGEMRRMQKRTETILTEMQGARSKILKTSAEVGPVVYLAEALGTNVDTVVKWLILVFILVFDPLAVCLVFCLNLAVRLREKYRGNELRIGAHAVSTPVDHRFKKDPFRKVA